MLPALFIACVLIELYIPYLALYCLEFYIGLGICMASAQASIQGFGLDADSKAVRTVVIGFFAG
jgi:hypothetical protein